MDVFPPRVIYFDASYYNANIIKATQFFDILNHE